VKAETLSEIFWRRWLVDGEVEGVFMKLWWSGN